MVSGRRPARLDDRRRAALIAHEQAHLASRHHLFTIVARLPPRPIRSWSRRPAGGRHRGTLVDEHAAAVTSDRRLVAETIGQVASLAGPRLTGSRRRRTAGLVLGIVGSRTPRVSLAWAGPVPRRVAALLTAPPRRQTILLAASTVIVLMAGVAALLAARDLHALLELAQGSRD